MNRRLSNENTARVLALAVVFFGGLAAAGLVSGVFERLGTETVAALALFAAAFAGLTYRLDAGVRAFVNGLFASRSAPRKRARDRAAAA